MCLLLKMMIEIMIIKAINLFILIIFSWVAAGWGCFLSCGRSQNVYIYNFNEFVHLPELSIYLSGYLM